MTDFTLFLTDRFLVRELVNILIRQKLRYAMRTAEIYTTTLFAQFII